MSTTLPESVAVELLVEQGIAAVKSGDTSRAAELLNEAVQIDPHNERAWLWLSGAVTTDAERRHCLEWVLAINPQNSAAQRGLAALPPRPEAAPAASVPAASAPQPMLQPQVETHENIAAVSPPETAAPPNGETHQLQRDFTPAIAPGLDGGNLWQVPPGMLQQADSVFDRDRFLLRQKHLSFSEKYYVWDELDQPILFVERPRHLLQNGLAAGASIFAAAFVLVGFIALTVVVPIEALQIVVFVLGLIGSLVTAVVILTYLMKKRHVTFYRDDSKQERLFEILQDQKFHVITATYTINDAQGKLLAHLRKNYLYNFFRKQWNCYGPDGSLILVAKEDSLVLSLLRRVLNSTLFGLLRTNFIFLAGQDCQRIGEFNRKFTILDRYVLDMSYDARRLFDRRIALALGVMLDTGERR